MDFPNTFYHVLSRGNERKEIFGDDRDYLRFLETIGRAVDKFHIEVHAYVLMPNHYHLLIRTSQANLSKAMHWLGVSYSVWFNQRHQRSGHLFQGRFKSFVIQDDNYFRAMCMYIHGNPLRAGIVKDLSEYKWSSYSSYAYKGRRERWLTTDLILSMCGGTGRRFNEAQESCLGKGSDLLNDLRYGTYLGSEEYAQTCLGRLKGEKHREKPQVKFLLKSQDIKETALRVLNDLGEKEPDMVLGSTRGKSRPSRDIAIYVLAHLGVFSNREIGEVFRVGYTAVTEAIKRAGSYLANNKGLKTKVKKLTIDI
jgi:putative transposase